jgi:rfaE bifunctional protein nucleotidyltransferase chain/domain
MQRVIDVIEAAKLSRKIRKEGKTLVLTGGCFDVLHLGHIRFLEAAKKSGDFLFVFVESDRNVKSTKGDNRPIHSQAERAEVLSSIRFIDYVIKMPYMENNDDYDKVTLQIKPSVIAITKNSAVLEHAKRQAQKTSSQVVEVIGRIPEKSTTKIAQIISDENKL